MKCLKCEKSLETLLDSATAIKGGGEMAVTFHYGSEYDMCVGWCGDGQTEENNTRLDRLLGCHLIKAYICDECFDKHSELFEGFVVSRPHPECQKVV